MGRMLLAVGQCLFALVFAVPGCFKEQGPPRVGLRTGMLAPEIRGEDLDGQPLRLSDYKGKVVVLSYWATWCGPCRALIPHERELVDRFKGRPFALLGVNCDQDRAAAQRLVQKEDMNWRSWWDGGSGSIQHAWQIEYYPTIYILDAAGVIRHAPAAHPNVGSEIERHVENLLREVEGRKG